MAGQTSDNIKSQMRKGILDYCMMLCLEKGEAYASNIIQTFREGNFEVVEGTLYPLLTRMKNSGVLGYRWEESTQGPPRKYYYLTDEGRELLRDLDEAYKEIETVINHIKNKQS